MDADIESVSGIKFPSLIQKIISPGIGTIFMAVVSYGPVDYQPDVCVVVSVADGPLIDPVVSSFIYRKSTVVVNREFAANGIKISGVGTVGIPTTGGSVTAAIP